MVNVQAVVLKILLSCTDKELALACFDKVKPHFFSSSYGTIHKAISQYYNDHNKIPSMEELSIKFSRSTNIQVALATLENLESIDVDLDMAIEALRDEYAQQEALSLISKHLLDDIHMLSADDLVDRLSTIPLRLEEKVDAGGNILRSAEIPVFQSEDDQDMDLIYTGLSNYWDNNFGGIARQELVLVGGGMGSGKSLMCANLGVAQWKMGNIAPYFTVEMSARETFMRMLGIIANVDALKVKNKALEGDELLRFALTRAKMFHGGAEAYKNFVRNKDNLKFSDFYELDRELMKNHEEIHPIIIVDDSDLRLSTIDVSMSKFITQYGKKVTMGLVDYLNVVREDERSDPYDWQTQLRVAEGLKRISRKHGVGIFAPYQTNDDGSARFSKSILVPVDIAIKLTPDHEGGAVHFDTAKVRSLPATQFNIGMDWTTLRSDPEPVSVEELSEKAAEAKQQAVQEKVGEGSHDL